MRRLSVNDDANNSCGIRGHTRLGKWDVNCINSGIKGKCWWNEMAKGATMKACNKPCQEHEAVQHEPGCGASWWT